jgi:hypothetical protein
MIDKLTPEQERLIDVYKNEFMKIGYDCVNIPDSEAINIINELYDILKKKRPRIVIVNSPLSCLKAYEILDKDINAVVDVSTISKIKTKTKDEINNFWFGQHYSYFYGYIKYFYDVLNFENKEKEKFEIALKLCKLHWFLPYEESCILSRKPEFIKVTPEGKLNGIPAVKYKDYELSFINGENCSPENVELYHKLVKDKNKAILEVNNPDPIISNIAKLAIVEK